MILNNLTIFSPARPVANAQVVLSSSAELLGLTIVEVGLLSVISSEAGECRAGLSLTIPGIGELNKMRSVNSSSSSELFDELLSSNVVLVS